MERNKEHRGNAVKDTVDFRNTRGLRKLIELEKLSCVHIPSVRVEESTFVD